VVLAVVLFSGFPFQLMQLGICAFPHCKQNCFGTDKDERSAGAGDCALGEARYPATLWKQPVASHTLRIVNQSTA